MAVAALVISACGGGDDESSPGDTRAPVVSATDPSLPAMTVPTAEYVERVAGVEVGFETVGDFEEPTALVFAPGDEGRAYVGQRTGVVLDLDLATGDAAAVLDISGETTAEKERGLLGLAIAPDGAHLYVSFTDLDGDSRIDEFELAGDGTLDEGTRRAVFTLDQPFANHNGGHLAFGPDGLLYIGLGDGGSAGDPLRAGQDPEQLLGSILRIDPRGVDGSAYAIPDDNPYHEVLGARPEVWLTGVRNPWRFSFDRITGDLWVADVGQDQIEEVNLLLADDDGRGAGRGANLGWNAMEGDRAFDGGIEPDDHTPPVFTYIHSEGDCSVIGGFVYQGRAVPELFGAYLFADHCAGELRALATVDGEVVDEATIAAPVDDPISFAQDPSGEVYLLTQPGPVFRITPT